MPAEITTPPVGVTLSPAARGLTQVSASRVEVRAFKRVPGTIRITDLSGAVCQIGNAQVSAVVTTPGVVNVPAFANLAPPLSYSCTDGVQTQTGGTGCYTIRGGDETCEYGEISVIFD